MQLFLSVCGFPCGMRLVTVDPIYVRRWSQFISQYESNKSLCSSFVIFRYAETVLVSIQRFPHRSFLSAIFFLPLQHIPIFSIAYFSSSLHTLYALPDILLCCANLQRLFSLSRFNSFDTRQTLHWQHQHGCLEYEWFKL